MFYQSPNRAGILIHPKRYGNSLNDLYTQGKRIKIPYNSPLHSVY